MLWLVFAAAHANVLPYNDDISQSGIVIIASVQDSQPYLQIGGRSLPLQDDGVAPDKIAGDSVFSLFFETNQERKYDLQLLSSEEEILWSGQISSTPQHQVWLWMNGNVGNDLRVKVEYKKLVNTHNNSLFSLDESQSHLYVRLAIAIAFFCLGLLVRRKAATQLQRIVAPFKHHTLNNPLGMQQVWLTSLSTHQQILLDALRAFAPSMNILLLTSEDGAKDLKKDLEAIGAVFTLSEKNTETHIVLSNFKNLLDLGPALLVVDGIAALEAPAPEEQPHQVAIELLKSTHSILLLTSERYSFPDTVYVQETEER